MKSACLKVMGSSGSRNMKVKPRISGDKRGGVRFALGVLKRQKFSDVVPRIENEPPDFVSRLIIA